MKKKPTEVEESFETVVVVYVIRGLDCWVFVVLLFGICFTSSLKAAVALLWKKSRSISSESSRDGKTR